MEEGSKGNIKDSDYMKESQICQIPGFKYTSEGIANIPRPLSWTEDPMEYAVIKSLKIFEFDLFKFKFSKDVNISFNQKPSNILWKTFTEYVKEK